MKTTTKLWLGILLLAVLSPLGLALPAHFKAGAAWGEWGIDQIKNLVGYIPGGLEKLSVFWKAPLPDYAFRGQEENGLPLASLSYIISALMGILVVALLAFFIGRNLARKGD